MKLLRLFFILACMFTAFYLCRIGAAAIRTRMYAEIDKQIRELTTAPDSF